MFHMLFGWFSNGFSVVSAWFLLGFGCFSQCFSQCFSVLFDDLGSFPDACRF